MSDHICYLLIAILLSHLIADFVFQPSWMAIGKSQCFLVLLLHVFIYTLTILAGLAIFNLAFPLIFSHYDLLAFLAFNFAGHFVTDAITSRVNKYYWNKQQYRHFFIGIGIDQFIHVVTLVYSVKYILRCC